MSIPVWIDRIYIETLGPLSERSFALDRFNLFYGANETGKTFLVEFLLQSLFRHAAKWSLRDLPGQGKVTMVGLSENQRMDFTPDSRKKLEDYWEEKDSGLPTNMAQLLVVKSGEPGFSTTAPGGVGRAALKTALSRETLLDQILNSIRKTVQDAEIRDGEINADRRAKNVQRREELRENLRKMEAILDQMEEEFSRGPLRTLQLELEKTQGDLEENMHAKQHRAYQTQRELDRWRERRDDLPGKLLDALHDNLRDYQKTQEHLSNKREELAEKEQASQHYAWLKHALESWESQALDLAGRPKPFFAAAGLVLILAGLVFALFQRPFLALIPLILGWSSIGYYLWRVRRWSQSITQSQARKNIRESYRDHFGKAFRDGAQLKARLESTREAHIQAKQIRSDMESLEEQLNNLSFELRSQLQDLTGEKKQEEEWEGEINAIHNRADEIDQRIRNLELEQRSLGVDEHKLRTHPADVPYDEKKLHSLEEKVQEIEAEIRGQEDELDKLKQRICDWTGDNIDISWNVILEHFRAKFDQAVRDYQQLTAEIVAKIGVTQVLEEVRQQEDEKIRRGLRSKEVIEILETVTGTYQSLDLSGEEIVVEGAYGDYPLRKLSTGAQEQIQLALRMGFASRLASGTPLFLILDDAFQDSDYERRQHLVKHVIKMAKQDWQVVYLTMDDHLRDLFQEAGERVFPDEFKSYTLS